MKGESRIQCPPLSLALFLDEGGIPDPMANPGVPGGSDIEGGRYAEGHPISNGVSPYIVRSKIEGGTGG